MSYEVIKTIGGRKYRYAVESYRDAESGRTKTKWRYLGKAESDAVPRRRARADETRENLTSAAERLLAKREWKDITANDVANEAGVAPATLYRYFASRDDVLLSCAARANAELDARLSELAALAQSKDEERIRLRAWTISMISDPSRGGVLQGIWSSGLANDEMARERNEHRREAFRGYIQALKRSRFTRVESAEVGDLATSLALIVQALSYRAVLGGARLSESEQQALADAVDRLVFR